MTVKLLVDMNLSPDWVPVLKSHGWSVVHWSTVGDPRASDRTIMEWAAKHEYVVLTHDLDFSAMLALSHAAGPSVLQVRAGDILPDHLEGSVIAALRQNDADLSSGALVVVDINRRSGSHTTAMSKSRKKEAIGTGVRLVTGAKFGAVLGIATGGVAMAATVPLGIIGGVLSA